MASQKLGSYAFLLGLIIAVIVGLVVALAPYLNMPVDQMIVDSAVLIIVVLGLIVGFLNIHDKHISDFLIATIAVAMVGVVITASGFNVGQISVIGAIIAGVVGKIVALAAPAALVVGLKQILALAKEQVN